jgi:hypothetical protein
MATSGCATKPQIVEKTVYVVTPLKYENMEKLPKLSNKEMSCLSEQTKKTLMERDYIMKSHIIDLETIIKSTQN